MPAGVRRLLLGAMGLEVDVEGPLTAADSPARCVGGWDIAVLI
jgi:hypothetical protein